MADVWLSFIRSARARTSLLTLSDFAESCCAQLTVDVLSQNKAMYLCCMFKCFSSARNAITKPNTSQ